MFLPLAERMTLKYLNEGKLEAEAGSLSFISSVGSRQVAKDDGLRCFPLAQMFGLVITDHRDYNLLVI